MLLVEVNDGHRLVSEGGESFAEGLDVVIISPAGLGPLLNALNHGIFVGVKEDTEGHVH